MPDALNVLAVPHLDPSAKRVNLQLPEGLTLSEIVTQSLPGLPQDAPIRLVLVTEQDAWPIDRQLWDKVRPKPGTQIVIRILPGEDSLRSILQVVVTIAAVALGQLWAVPLAGALGISTQLAGGLISLGITALGNLLINALVPPPAPVGQTGDERARNSYTITGWKNRFEPDAPVPAMAGRRRYAPPFGAVSYTEIVGDVQYVRALFIFGYGQQTLTEFRLGETPLDDYDEVQTEIRAGKDTDQPLTLFSKQVIEDAAGVVLTRPRLRNDAGEVINGTPPETPVVRVTARDTETASVILSFPSGLIGYTQKGSAVSLGLNIRIRQRPLSGGSYQTVTTLNIQASKREAFYRQYTWKLPYRGRWEIEVTRMTVERLETSTTDRCTLLALQSIRPEYPLNFDKPMALVAMRIKATYQLSGSLENFNALCELVCLDWDKDAQAWILGKTRNPASIYRWFLQGPANAYPEPDSAIDLDQLADWHEWCEEKGLEYNRVHDEDLPLKDVLFAVTAAGRATPHHDGLKWGVVIDRPQELVVDHISPRNSRNFRWERTYFDPPDAFRVPFFDETNDYEPAERIVPWPTHVGDIKLTEEIQLPGKTSPREVWLEARRRMYELLYRPDRYQAMQDGAARAATRGDLVMGSFDVLERTQVASRVANISGRLLTLDEEVTMEDGEGYGIRFRTGLTEEDTIGRSEILGVLTKPGASRTLTLREADTVPEIGDLVHFGPINRESLPLIVKGVESGEDFSGHYTLIDAAPEIDDLLEQESIPEWSGRIGEDLGSGGIVPAIPVFTSILTGVTGTGDPNGLSVLLSPGSANTAEIGSYEISHRLSGAGSWTMLSVPTGSGGTAVTGYSSGDSVELSARAIAIDGIPGPSTATVTVQIGADDGEMPDALPGGATVSGGLGVADIDFSTGSDATLNQVQIYRVPEGELLDRTIHKTGQPISVAQDTAYQVSDGDSTRASIVANGSFASAANWTLGDGWSIGAGVATHAAGSAATLTQAIALTGGKVYRLGFEATVTGGTLTPRLEGGTTVSGGTRDASGSYSDRLTADAGSDTLAFSANSALNGTVDTVVLFEETDDCAPQGTYDYYIEPINTDGQAGPVTGPLTATII
ncbi:phage tail protein [Roseibium porphyridii]|uniref:Phage tail protein n=1 Tax=Roseibium porphyridii TaxID=2866279 RepID=A0ABY8FDN3_9HYPH|nr:phage tail protein [Roseibium sp. KMA01]WFE92312.1 phage tail protein [Roseibium sp. KMA01]